MAIYGLIKDGGSVGWDLADLPGIAVSGTRRVLIKRTGDNVIGWYDTLPHGVGLFLAKNDATGQAGWMDPAAVFWVP